MRYKTEDIDLLMSQLSIVDIVGEAISLKKTGANYKGLCPFHDDSSPSFVVNPQKNICKCFVCGSGGNPITFYSKWKKISFVEAVRELALKYNVDIKETVSNKDTSHLNKYYEIMEEAHNFYKENIFSKNSHRALEYLANRGINSKIITDNGIGFASGKSPKLVDYLTSKGYSHEDLMILGLIREGDTGNYDFFRERIIFPIFSSFNKVIAFGGRTIESNSTSAKYYNSQETPIFHKGKNLYGLERGQSIRKKNYAILMEGYMDVLSANIYGFDTAVAPLGTSLTEDQGIILKKYTSSVLLCFDSDNAGQMATEKSILILTKLGFDIRVILLNGAKDPDEYLKAYGREAFLERVRNSPSAFDFLYDYYAKDFDLTDIFSKSNFISKFKEYFQVIPKKIVQDEYIDSLTKSLGVSSEGLVEELISNNQTKVSHPPKVIKPKEVIEKKEDLDELERETISYVITNMEDLNLFQGKPFENRLTKKIFNFLEEAVYINSNNFVKELKELSDIEENEKVLVESIICNAAIGFKSEQEKKIKRFEIYTGWFRKELNAYKSTRENLSMAFKIAQINGRLQNCDDFSEILDIYKEFEKNVVFQDI